MSRTILTVTLNPSLDRTLIENKKEIVYAGGKGINVARVLTNLGRPTVTTGIIGGYCAKEFEGFLSKERIRHQFLRMDAEVRTNLNIVSPHHSRIRILETGSVVDSDSLQKFVLHFKELLKNTSAVVLSGRNANGAPADFLAELILSAKKKNIPVVLDSSGEALKNGIKAKPWMIKPNFEEACELAGSSLNSMEKLKKFCLSLNRKGVDVVIVSLWLKGAVISCQDQVWYAKPPKVSAVNDVGCGDALVAGFIHYFLKKHSLENSFRRSIGVGILQALSHDPRKIDFKKNRGIINAVSIKRI